jgi:O-6-methylguanine DNA methyltransferase
MLLEIVRYEVDGWGVGDLRLLDGAVLMHERPRPGSGLRPQGDHPLVARFRAHLAGERSAYDDVELMLDGYTPLQLALIAALRAIPWGETVSYGELAALAGAPRAPRAAGAFCATSQLALIVPCHRVVASNGIGGYGADGVATKRRLLALEGVAL